MDHQSKKKVYVKRTLLVIAILASLLAAAACQKKADETAPQAQAQATPTPPEDPVVIKVNGADVKLSEFQAAIESIPEQMRGAIATPAGKKVLAEELVRMKVLEMEGGKLGLDRDPAVAGRIAVARANILANAAVQKLTEQSKLTPEQLYEKTKSKFETAKVRQILIPFQGSVARPASGKPLSEAAAKAKADELVVKLRGGADFAATARKESADPMSRDKGGDLGELTRGGLPDEVAAAVFSLQPKAVSDPVRTRAGYHIFLVESKSVKSFEDMKAFLEQQGDRFEAESIIEDLRKNAKVEFDPKFFPDEKPDAPAALAGQ
jgi:parvulin-like peptidyl-prolyl isomerase